jgi:hypothetical protein
MKLFQIKKISKFTWSREEDEILLLNAQINGKNQWTKISTLLPGKTPYQCYLRYRSIRPGLKKGSWTKEEDNRIAEGIELFGKQWAMIAKALFNNRNSKQIRDRYINYLDPRLKKEKFTVNEDMLILELFEKYGPKWSIIQRHLDGRSSDAIKNRYNSSIRRNKQIHYIIKLLNGDGLSCKVSLNVNFSIPRHIYLPVVVNPYV